MRGKRALLLLTALSLVLTLLAGCGNTAPETGEKTMVIGDTTFNSENWEETVDPHRTYNGWACIRYGIGETLVRYTDSMELEPWLARSWSNDGDRTWTIVLQDNVTFSSGRKMDAAAVKQCLEHLLENHDRAPGDTKIADMQAEGQTLTIVTSQPNPALMNYLGDPYGCIIDVDASDFEKGIVAGTGPYVVQELVTDDHLTLTKNENYWNGSPKLDKLTIRTISDGDTLSAALQAGNIDAAYGMAYEAYPNFENDDYQFSAIQTSRAFFASMNMASPVMQDPAVRKAIAMGIDKQGFVTALLDGHGVVGTGAFPDGFSGFGGENVTTESYDPEGARQVLEAAGWRDTDGDGIREKDGVKLTAVYSIPASVLRSTVTVEGGTAKSTLGEGSDIPAEIGTTVEITATPYDAEKYPGMEFVEWEIKYPDSFYQNFPDGIPENLQLKLDNAKSATTTFKMPAYPVKLIAHWSASAVVKPDPDEPIDEDFGVEPAPMDTTGGAIAAVAVGGAAIWGGYEIATRVILHNLLPEGAAIPANRGQLALLVWNTAGRPEPVNTPAFADVADADTAKAAQWCVEQGLLDAKSESSFKPEGWMPKFKTIEVWEKAFPKQ